MCVIPPIPRYEQNISLDYQDACTHKQQDKTQDFLHILVFENGPNLPFA